MALKSGTDKQIVEIWRAIGGAGLADGDSGLAERKVDGFSSDRFPGCPLCPACPTRAVARPGGKADETGLERAG